LLTELQSKPEQNGTIDVERRVRAFLLADAAPLAPSQKVITVIIKKLPDFELLLLCKSQRYQSLLAQ
jgi:hypothetical protein